MNRRLHRAISEASELRAMLVLLVVLALRARHFLQLKYQSLPSLFEIIQHIQSRFNARLTYYLYKDHAHWLGTR